MYHRISRTLAFSLVSAALSFTPNILHVRQHFSLPASTSIHHNTGTYLHVSRNERSVSLRVKEPVGEEVAVVPEKSVLQQYAEYSEELEALSFLSSISGDQDLCQRAQGVFDAMYEIWSDDDDEDLEPSTEIYNLLISVYSNCAI
jgi:hypothetical protein